MSDPRDRRAQIAAQRERYRAEEQRRRDFRVGLLAIIGAVLIIGGIVAVIVTAT
jgi:hypothetical protein